MTQISPGVITREVDLSSYVPGVNTTVGAFCGVFRWGPLDEIVTLSNEGELVKRFGKPDLDTATSFFTAARFLSYADALRVVRAAGVGALNATAENGTGTGAPGVGVLIKNGSHYESNFSGGLPNVGPFAARCPGALGNSIEISVCPSSAAFNQTLAGTVTSVGTEVSGDEDSEFISRVAVGSIVKDTVSGQERKVVDVVDDATLVVDRAFSPALSGATLVAKWEFADAIGVAPGTSEFVLNKGGSNDQIHVVVIDRGGEFTNIPGTVLERYSFMSKASDAMDEDGTSSYYVNRINRNSAYVYWTDHLPAGLNWGSKSSGTSFTQVNKPTTMRLTGGRDVNSGSSIDAARNLGYDLFSDTESIDIALLLCGEASSAVALHVLGIAETRQDCIAIVSPEKDDVVAAVGREAANVIEFRNTLTSTSYGVMSSNWLNIYDKYRDTFVWIPDNGDLAGITARADTQSHPWVSPAGYNRGTLKEVVKLAWNPRKAARDDLYLSGVNFVVSQAGSGPVWIGDKTLLARPSAFDRINVRRLFIVLRKSISIVAKSLIHEINDDVTRNNFKNQVEPFLKTVQARRGIYDSKVVCDGTNNTAEVVDRNEFVGDIYVKPAKSISFITLNFVATRSGVAFNEVVGKF
jgi:hypothetical protein